MERCGARARSTGGRCRKPAGWGTDHNGVGRCRLHGGATPIRSGKYSKVTRYSLADLLRTNGPQLLGEFVGRGKGTRSYDTP